MKDIKLPVDKLQAIISFPTSPDMNLAQDFDFTDAMSKTSYFSPSKVAVVDQMMKNRQNSLTDRSTSTPITPPFNNNVVVDAHFPSIPFHVEKHASFINDNMSSLTISTSKYV